MRKPVGFALALSLVTPALAENTVLMPDFPVQSICLADNGCRGCEAQHKSCIEKNRSFYENSRMLWAQLSQKSAQRCVAHVKQPSLGATPYAELYNCISYNLKIEERDRTAGPATARSGACSPGSCKLMSETE